MKDKAPKPTEALHKDKDYYRYIVDHIQEAVIVIDENYRIVDANKTICSQYRIKYHDIINKHCYSIR